MGARLRVLVICASVAVMLGTFQNCAKDIPQEAVQASQGSQSASQPALKSCTAPNGVKVASGFFITLFKVASPTPGSPCESQLRTCTDGVLSGSYAVESCSTTEPTPAALDFPDLLDANLSAVVTTKIVQVSGFTGTASVTISGGGGGYRTCNDAACATVIANWSSDPGTIAASKYIQLRQTSASVNDSTSSTILKLGNAAAVTWKCVTFYKATIAAGRTNLDIKTLFTAEKWAQNVRKLVVVPAGVTVGSTGAEVAAIRTNTGWAGELTLQVDGTVEGAGGGAGAAGGSAVLVEQAGLKVVNNGIIRAGGGGGGTGGKGGSKSNTTNTREPASGQNYEWSGSWKYGVITEAGDYGAIREVYWAGASIPTSMVKDGWTYHRGDAVQRGGGFFFFCGGYPSCWYEHKIYRTRSDTTVTAGGTGGAGGRGRGYNVAPTTGALGAAGANGSGAGGVGGTGGEWGQSGGTGATGALSGTAGTAGGPAGFSLQMGQGIARPVPTGNGQFLGR